MKEIFTSGKKIIKTIISGVIIAAVLVLCWPATCVERNSRGITLTFNAAGDKTLSPGLNFRIPIVQTIKQWSIVPKDYDVTISIDTNGAVSKDNQIIGVRAVVYWKYNENKIPVIAKNWSDERIEQQLKVISIESIKTIVGQYTIFDLPGSMSEISSKVFQLVKSRTESVDMPIEVTMANITNFDWSQEFDKRINDTMAAAQRVKEAEQQALISEQEQRKLAIEAEAKAKALVAQAEGEKLAAELRKAAKIAEGEGIAEYNRLLAQNRAQMEAQWKHDEEIKRLEKWDGRQVPTYIPMLPPGYQSAAER